MAVPGCTRPNFDLGGKVEGNSILSMPSCLGFPYSVIVPATPALRDITKHTDVCQKPNSILWLVVSTSAFCLPRICHKYSYQARNSVSHLRLKILSPFVKSDEELICEVEGIIPLQLDSVFQLSLKLLEFVCWVFTFLLYPYKYVPVTRIDQYRSTTTSFYYREHAWENQEPEPEVWAVVYVCCSTAYHRCFLTPGYDMYILGDKERTEGSAERAGISNGKIRCMTIRYIIVKFFFFECTVALGRAELGPVNRRGGHLLSYVGCSAFLQNFLWWGQRFRWSTPVTVVRVRSASNESFDACGLNR